MVTCSSRPWISRTLLGLACLAQLGCTAEEATQPAPRNLLIVAIDTLRPDVLGAYGRTPSPSPNIDGFANVSVVFDNATSHAPWTLPSFGTLLTSLYASTHGLFDFESRLASSFTTLAEIFRAAGFATAGIGSHVFFDARYGLQQGFDHFDDELAHESGQEGWVAVTSPLVSAKAIEWLRARRGQEQPWLLWAHYFDPHLPFLWHGYQEGEPQPPERERYEGEVRFTDHYVGEVFRVLEELEMLDDTAVLLVSDHGEAFGEHAGVRYHGKSLHREELHVPLILYAPGLVHTRIEAPVRTVDVLPTLLDLFQLDLAALGLADPTRPLQGRSLLPLVRGETLPAVPELAELRLHPGHHFDSLVDRSQSWKLITRPGRQPGHAQLYDLRRDRAENRNRAGRAPDEVARLATALDAMRGDARKLRADLQPAAPVELSRGELEHLRALGYIDESDAPQPGGEERGNTP